MTMLTGDGRERNRRTALILLTIALAFFAGVVAKVWLLSS